MEKVISLDAFSQLINFSKWAAKELGKRECFFFVMNSCFFHPETIFRDFRPTTALRSKMSFREIPSVNYLKRLQEGP